MTFGTSVTKQDLKERNNMFQKICLGNLDQSNGTVQTEGKKHNERSVVQLQYLCFSLLLTPQKKTPSTVFLG